MSPLRLVHLNLRVRDLRPSATVAINERSNRLRAEGREIFKLGLGQSPFPVPAPVVDSLREHAAERDYLAVRGLAQLREAIADYQRRVHGVTRSADDVLVAPGSKELMFLLQLVYYGELVIPTPAWVSYAPQAQIAGRTVRFVATELRNDWKLGAEELDALCREDPGRPRVLVLNYPSNPTGCSYSLDELRELADVARRQSVVVLSDEIYGELHHNAEHASIARFYPEGTIISGGLSKWCGAGGWRLGAFVFPPELRRLLEAMESVASETYTSTSAPIQYAAVSAFRGSLALERYLSRVRHILGALAQSLVLRLRAAELRVATPVGAFYLFADFTPHARTLVRRGIHGDVELCEALLEKTGVAILPGSAFGRAPRELTARLALVDFDGARALAAAEALPPEAPIDKAFIERYCDRTVAAVERLCDWLVG